MADNPVCPETGAPMRRDTRPMTLNYRGQSITFDMPGWYCDASDQSTHTGEDMKVSDRMLNRLKARSEGLSEPEGIRRIRKKLGLSQAAAGELIGGGPRAFQKYEAGDLLPSRAISSALALLDNDPKALRVLEARFHQAEGDAKGEAAGERRAAFDEVKRLSDFATQRAKRGAA